MRSIRLYVASRLAIDSEVEISGQQFQHLVKVLRAQPGQDVVLFNGEGGEYHGSLREVQKRKAIICLERFDPVEREARIVLELVQGISRNERMDYTIQKAVELGVARIQPIMTCRSVIKLDESRAAKRHEHWLGVIASACEQCGRNTLPELRPVMSIQEFLAGTDETASPRLLLDPDGDTGIRDIRKPSGTAQLLVGPEGGLDESEIAAAVQAGFTRIRLGKRVLRTETAAMVAAAALFTCWGEFD